MVVPVKILMVLGIFGLSLLVALLISAGAAIALTLGLSVLGIIMLVAGRFVWAGMVAASVIAFALRFLVL